MIARKLLAFNLCLALHVAAVIPMLAQAESYHLTPSVVFKISGSNGLYCLNGLLGSTLQTSQGEFLQFREELRRISRQEILLSNQISGLKRRARTSSYNKILSSLRRKLAAYRACKADIKLCQNLPALTPTSVVSHGIQSDLINGIAEQNVIWTPPGTVSETTLPVGRIFITSIICDLGFYYPDMEVSLVTVDSSATSRRPIWRRAAGDSPTNLYKLDDYPYVNNSANNTSLRINFAGNSLGGCWTTIVKYPASPN